MAMNFNNLHNTRKTFMLENKNKDHVVIKGNNNVVISAPHGVSQVRLGRLKFSEIGSVATALYLQEKTGSHLIAKTKNNNDDANFDEVSTYKKALINLIKTNNIKYVIDIHGLGAKREYDVNLGTHLGKNISSNVKAFNSLNGMLENSGFKVSVDQPFMGGANTISGSMKNLFPNIFTLQIEINCTITNHKENFEKYKTLLKILDYWIKSL